MEKSIKIGDKEITLNNNISWMMIYRDQFGTDILPVLMPALASVLDIVSGILENREDVDGITAKDIIGIFRSDAGIDALAHLSGLEIVDFINITWALAKTADESIPEPKRWVKQFDEFPMDEIAPTVFELATRGVVSSKNLGRLKKLTENLQPVK